MGYAPSLNPLYLTNGSSSSNVEMIPPRIQAGAVRAREIENIFIEVREKEEDERTTLRDEINNDSHATFPYVDFSIHFFRQIKNCFSIKRPVAFFSAFGPPYLALRVLRL
jgi:hypothetical protein